MAKTFCFSWGSGWTRTLGQPAQEGDSQVLNADLMWIVEAVVFTTSSENFIGIVLSFEMHHWLEP